MKDDLEEMEVRIERRERIDESLHLSDKLVSDKQAIALLKETMNRKGLLEPKQDDPGPNPFPNFRLLSGKGKPASQIVLEDRD